MSAAASNPVLSGSTENLLQPAGDETKPTIIPLPASGGVTSSAGVAAVKPTPGYSSTTYLFTESEPFTSASATNKPSTSVVAISNAAAEAAQQQSNRNRIPLALCSQQTALSTPGASLSVDEAPIMISTDEDTDQTTSLILPVAGGQNLTATTSQIISSNSRIDPLINAESTRSVPELELHSRTRTVAVGIAGGGSTDKYSIHSEKEIGRAHV